MPVHFENNLKGALVQPLTAGDNWLYLGEAFFRRLVNVDSEGQPDWPSTKWMYLTLFDPANPEVTEIVSLFLADPSDFSFQVSRAVDGTQALDWATGTVACGFVTAQMMRDVMAGMFKADDDSASFEASFQTSLPGRNGLKFSTGRYEAGSTYALYELDMNDPTWKSEIGRGLFQTNRSPYEIHYSLFGGKVSAQEFSSITDYSSSAYIVKGDNFIFRACDMTNGMYDGSVSLGAFTVANGAKSVALGHKSMARAMTYHYSGNNPGAFACGVKALALHDDTTAVGIEAIAAGPRSASLGANAVSLGERSTALGADAFASVDNEFAISGLSVMAAPGYGNDHYDPAGSFKTGFETLLCGRFCDIGTPVVWTPNTPVRHGDVFMPTSGGTRQFVRHVKAFDPDNYDNVLDTGSVEPDWDGMDTLHWGYDTGTDLRVHWVLPTHVRFLVTEVGFIAHKMGAGVTSAGKIALGTRDQPTALLNDVALPGAPAAGRMHRITLDAPLALDGTLMLSLTEIAAGGSYVGHFYLRGVAVRTQG